MHTKSRICRLPLYPRNRICLGAAGEPVAPRSPAHQREASRRPSMGRAHAAAHAGQACFCASTLTPRGNFPCGVFLSGPRVPRFQPRRRCARSGLCTCTPYVYAALPVAPSNAPRWSAPTDHPFSWERLLELIATGPQLIQHERGPEWTSFLPRCSDFVSFHCSASLGRRAIILLRTS